MRVTDSISEPLHGKTCIVTGATSGLGYEVARAAAHRGAAVIGVGRDRARCEQAASAIRRESGNSSVAFEIADLSRQSEIRALAGRLPASEGSIDVLINNAAAFSFVRRLTVDGVELQFAVNYLAGFLLTALLFDRLAPGARIMTVSSSSHYSGRIHWNNLALHPFYNGLAAYRQSKLANVLFTYELARRIDANRQISCSAVDPGLVNTKIGMKGTGPLVRTIWRLRAAGGVPPEEAARPIVELAAAEVGTKRTGCYWKAGRPVASSRRSYDTDAARRLWRLSEGLCSERFLEGLETCAPA